MKLTDNDRHEKYFDRAADWLGVAVRGLLNLLMIVVVAALVVGIAKAGVDLIHNFRAPVEELLQDVLLDVVFILALTEIAITLIGYLKDGQVHVRYIIDTVLIIMVNEIVSMWFRHPSLTNAASLSIIVATLALVRIGLTRFTPQSDK